MKDAHLHNLHSNAYNGALGGFGSQPNVMNTRFGHFRGPNMGHFKADTRIYENPGYTQQRTFYGLRGFGGASAYQFRSVRSKQAWACAHTHKVHYAKGLCQNCYLAGYYRDRKSRQQMQAKAEPGNAMEPAAPALAQDHDQEEPQDQLQIGVSNSQNPPQTEQVALQQKEEQ